MKMNKLIFFVFFILISSSSFALDLGVPVICQYGQDCFISGYFDHNPKKDEESDYTCGKLSDDGQVSTDFQLKNMSVMKEGVNVVATDSGNVTYIRDGMSDVSVDLVGKESVRGRECGNGVVISHKRGYETQYCHLKQKSIAVKVGDKVEKGQIIGQVGLSGVTNAPHLEYTVRVNGKALDPFTGDDPTNGNVYVICNSLDIYPLWDKRTEKKLKYIATLLLGSGFTELVPNAMGALEGKFSKEKIKDDAKVLAFWVDIFGVAKDDDLKLSITAPDGSILSEETRKVSADKKELFQFLGKKTSDIGLSTGEYLGKVELIRKIEDQQQVMIQNQVKVDVVNRNNVVKAGEEKK